MLKLLLLELLKSYLSVSTQKKEKKRYSNYFVGSFAVIALILLMIADYIYIGNNIRYISYLGNILLISTTFLVVAVVIKLICLWLELEEKQEKPQELLDSRGLSNIFKDIVPVLVSMIPISIVAYILWAKIQVKFFGKKVDLKNALLSLKRLW